MVYDVIIVTCDVTIARHHMRPDLSTLDGSNVRSLKRVGVCETYVTPRVSGRVTNEISFPSVL